MTWFRSNKMSRQELTDRCLAHEKEIARLNRLYYYAVDQYDQHSCYVKSSILILNNDIHALRETVKQLRQRNEIRDEAQNDSEHARNATRSEFV